MIKVIFWDFDGVLMDSNFIRDFGFERVLSNYPIEQIQELLSFHKANGGLSRYVKFRYFFENIRNESISDEEIMIWADKFSLIMKKLLTNPKLLIDETINFIKENKSKYIMHITSGSDQEELRYLCKHMKLEHLFSSINGSPTPKIDLIKKIIHNNGYFNEECILIGDSINDWIAAVNNNIYFQAYNSPELNEKSTFILL